ncbi:MAG: Kazal-type serine protease inhibitor domain-containing protein, partial [Bradymonadaceae bacterium]
DPDASTDPDAATDPDASTDPDAADEDAPRSDVADEDASDHDATHDAGTTCPDANDPDVHYISHEPLTCAAAAFICEDTQTMFNDECGCGCIGPSESSGNSCGGFAGDLNCEADEFCVYPKGDPNNVCYIEGVCTKIPGGACSGEFDPVCGCDGQTYSNACEAHTAGVDYAATGPCQL